MGTMNREQLDLITDSLCYKNIDWQQLGSLHVIDSLFIMH